MNGFINGLLVAVVMTASLSPAVADDVFVAGVKPDERPSEAPRITELKHQRDWYVKALTGVAPPYPRSLFFLDAQGAWYTPFDRPGMPGPYDIRGWHKSN